MDEEKITEDWLKEIGFKWHEDDQSVKHWVLWIGSSIAENRAYPHSASYEDFGIELSKFNKHTDVWYCFFRADYAGRYSRFIFCRDVWKREQLTKLIEALTDTTFDMQNVLYGNLFRPEQAAYYRRQEEHRLDRQMALKHHWRDDEQDETKAVKK